MSYPTLRLPWLIGMVTALMPLVTNAHTEQTSEQIACPTLLTQRECLDYQMEQRQVRSDVDRTSFEDKYTALLNERSRLCPLTILDAVAERVHDFETPGATTVRLNAWKRRGKP